jgi:hypothetical protein
MGLRIWFVIAYPSTFVQLVRDVRHARHRQCDTTSARHVDATRPSSCGSQWVSGGAAVLGEPALNPGR